MTSSPSRRLARWVLIGVIAFTVSYPVIYAIAVPEQIGAPARLPNVPDGKYRVYIVDWGYHTAIFVPQPAGWTLGPPGTFRQSRTYSSRSGSLVQLQKSARGQGLSERITPFEFL